MPLSLHTIFDSHVKPPVYSSSTLDRRYIVPHAAGEVERVSDGDAFYGR